MMCSHVDQDCCGLAAEQHCVLSDKPPQGSAPDQLTRFRASITPAQPEKTQETSRNGPNKPLWGQTQLYGSPLRPSLLGSPWLFARGAKSRLRAGGAVAPPPTATSHLPPSAGGMTEVSAKKPEPLIFLSIQEVILVQAPLSALIF